MNLLSEVPGSQMLHLSVLLLTERCRTVQRDFGWPVRLSLWTLSLAATSWLVTRLTAHLGPPLLGQMGFGLNVLWLGLIIVGVLTGKDLTWHISLRRLTFFPISFRRLYGLTTLLALLNFPVLIGLLVLVLLSWEAWLPQSSGLPAQFAAFILTLLSVRLSVSLVRTALLGSFALQARTKTLLWAGILLSVGLAGGCTVYTDVMRWFPGYQLASIIAGTSVLRPVLILGSVVPGLLYLDYLTQMEVVFRGFAGPPPLNTSRKWTRILWLAGPSPLATLWRLSFLGWLRHRSALLMWIFGTTYGFLFLYVAGDVDQSSCLMFIMMNLLFHGAFRGNLLGIDHRGTWLYFMFPTSVEKSLSAKNLSLTSWQICMVGGVLLAAAVRPTAEMTHLVGWLFVCSFVCTAILLGETAGSIFSVLCPEPISRSSRYSGGTATGALIVPILQAVLMGGFFAYNALAFELLTPSAARIPLLIVPITLWIVKVTVLPRWIRKTMIERRETLLRNLSA
ncbi:MAG: hypothetical protein P8020_03475 [Acidobacteriota bacterium]